MGQQSLELLTDARSSGQDLSAVATEDGALLPKATPGCTGGIVYDDNTWEDGVQPGTGALNGGFLMRFDPPTNAESFDQMCLCWTRPSTGDASIIHDVVMFAADGPAGGPGTELARESFFTTGISALFPSGSIFQYALNNEFQLPGGGASVYIGAAGILQAVNTTIFLCADENGGGTQPLFNTNTGNWVSTSAQFPAIDAFGIRADAVLGIPPPPPPAGECVPDANTLCIDTEPGNKRFEITLEVDSAAGGGLMVQAQAIPLGPLGIDRGGILHFGNGANPEVLVKILNGCNNNGNFWVFAAASTNLGFTMTVTDTLAGVSKQYNNPDLEDAVAITDTQAFATCDAQ